MSLTTNLVSFLGATSTTAAAAKKSSGSILDPIAKPIADLLAAIYSVVPNYGVAILVLSVIWMLIISPLTLKSTRSMLAMQKLQPELKRLQQKHQGDRQAFAQAQMELFREHQVSPFGSCLPMILPLPVFFALFKVIDGLSHISHGTADPKYLSSSTRMYHDIVAAHGQLNAFGMDLAKNAFSHHSGFFGALPFWLLLLIMAGTGYLQSAQMMSRNPAASQNPQMRMMKYLPVLFVVFTARFPAGVLLYYSMSNVCRIVQQDAMYRFDPKVKALVAKEVEEVEEITEEIDRDEGPDGRRGGSGRGGDRSPAGRGPGGSGSPAAGGGAARRTDDADSSPPTKPAGGRSRFRDMLAAAADQQQKQQPAKTERQADRTNRNGTGDGSPATGNGSGNGSRSKKNDNPAPPPPRPRTPPKGVPQRSDPRGHRTNRKRRGR
jgi:YidC/Oxa1 family membrane protein insertase